MITHTLSDLPEEYQTIMVILEDKLDDKEDPITSDKIWLNERKISTKSFKIKLKYLYENYQYNSTCMNCRKYRHKGKYCWYKEGVNIPKCHCYEKPYRSKNNVGGESGKKN